MGPSAPRPVATRRLAGVAAVVVVAALAAAPAGSAPPPRGLFVPGQSLGGLELGMTQAEVTAAWGKRHGVCRDCRRLTWYFNYRPFEPQGAAVVFHRGRVARLYTVWSPQGWRSARGVVLGDDAGLLSEIEGPFVERECAGYTALVLAAERDVESVFYVHEERLWAFGLMRAGASPCV